MPSALGEACMAYAHVQCADQVAICDGGCQELITCVSDECGGDITCIGDRCASYLEGASTALAVAGCLESRCGDVCPPLAGGATAHPRRPLRMVALTPEVRMKDEEPSGGGNGVDASGDALPVHHGASGASGGVGTAGGTTGDDPVADGTSGAGGGNDMSTGEDASENAGDDGVAHWSHPSHRHGLRTFRRFIKHLYRFFF